MEEEKLYIARLAVSHFNEQFQTTYDYTRFEVITIAPNPNTTYGFEIYTYRLDDYLRLRLYVTLGDTMFIAPYRIYDEMNSTTGLGDEIFVTDSVVDNEFLYLTNNYIRRSAPNLVGDPTILPIILNEDGADGLLMEGGDYILLEDAVQP